VAGRGRHSADDALAAELAAGKTVRDAATAAGVAERTAFRRMTDSNFKARVSALRGDMVATAAGRLADGMGEAAGVLRALLADGDVNVRHRAAVKLLELGLKVVEMAELQRRVDDLERRLTGGPNP
jgi:hypothetical protein